MATYNKVTNQYFPDFCDQVIRGRNEINGAEFEIKTPNIVNNPMKWVDNLTGEVNPSWKDQVRRGVDASTVMSATGSTVNARRCVISVITASVTGHPLNRREFRWDGYPIYAMPVYANPSASVLSNARNQALRKFLQRANAIRTSVEGGQALGEWKETVRAITNPLGALRQFIVRHVLNTKKRLRRINSHGGRSRGARRNYKGPPRSKAMAAALADTYLEFVFGWIPLKKDIQDAIAGLLDRYDQPDRVIIKGKGIVGWNESATDQQLFNTDFIEVLQSRISVNTVDYRFRASIKTGAINGVRSVSSTLGILPERFLPTVWELIPYSFVVDYFLNIGDIIESYAFQRCGIEWGTRTIRTKSAIYYGTPRCVFMQSAPAGYYPSVRRLVQMGATGGAAEVNSHHVDRLPIYLDNLFPDLQFHLPVETNAPWKNIGALLTQKFCSL